MGKLYKVGEYGEMKLGEFRKNIMQYTRNNLRSIISSSDPEIVEIAIDELTRRGEELKEGGRTGLRRGGGIDSISVSDSFKDDPPDRGPDNEPNPADRTTFNPETGREGSSGADRRDQNKVQQTQPRNDDYTGADFGFVVSQPPPPFEGPG